jgi:hypothetical protein
MKRLLTNWKYTLAIFTINLFIFAQPAITYACDVGAGHGGC